MDFRRPATLASVLVSLVIVHFVTVLTKPSLLLGLALAAYWVLLPGLAFAAALRLHTERGWERGLYAVGLGLIFVLFCGLLAVGLGYLAGMPTPLTDASIRIILTLGFLSILAALWIHADSDPTKPTAPYHVEFGSWHNDILILGGALAVALAIIGTRMIDTGHGNGAMIAMYCVIAATVFFAAFRSKTLLPYAYAATLMLLSLSLLWSVGLRSEHLVGWDINVEHSVARQTIEQSTWNPSANEGNTYYAMLSITVLPAMLHPVTTLSPEALYKFAYPLLGALITVAAFLFFRRYVPDVLAFIAAFSIAAQPDFAFLLPALARQSVAFFAFALLLLALFSRSLTASQRMTLGTLFGTLMIVSHYSTAYVALGALIATAAAVWFLTLAWKVYPLAALFSRLKLRDPRVHPAPKRIPILFVLGLLLISGVWYAVVTDAADDIEGVSTGVLSGLPDIFSGKLRSNAALSAIGYAARTSYTPEETAMYMQKQFDSYRYDYPKEQYYADSASTTSLELRRFPITNPELSNGFWAVHGLFRLAMKVLILGGVALLLFIELRRREYDSELIFLAAALLSLVIAIIVLPLLSVYYDVQRLYLQSLIVIALAAAYVWTRVPARFSTYAAPCYALIVVAFFLPATGIAAATLGGHIPFALYNNGPDVENFVVLEPERSAIVWIDENIPVTTPLFADTHARLHVTSFGARDRLVLDQVFPHTIFLRSAVLANERNVRGVGAVDARPHLNGEILRYPYPDAFLRDVKNVVYSNSAAVVYR